MTETAMIAISIWSAVCGMVCLFVGTWGVFADLERPLRDRRSRAERRTARVVFMTLALSGAANLAVMVHVVASFFG